MQCAHFEALKYISIQLSKRNVTNLKSIMYTLSVCVWARSPCLPFFQFTSNNDFCNDCLICLIIPHFHYFCCYCFFAVCMQCMCEVTTKIKKKTQKTNLGSLKIPFCSPGEPISCWHPSAMELSLPSSSRKSLYQQPARPLWPQCVTPFTMVAGQTKLWIYIGNRGGKIRFKN